MPQFRTCFLVCGANALGVPVCLASVADGRAGSAHASAGDYFSYMHPVRRILTYPKTKGDYLSDGALRNQTSGSRN